LLYLVGGTALTVECARRNAAPRAAAPASTAPDEGSPPSAPAPLTPPRPSSIAPERQRAIADAIVNGVWFLREQQLDTGSWGVNVPEFAGDLSVALAALPGLALVECGVPTSDPAVSRAADFVRQHAPQLTSVSPYDTYQTSLALLFLDRMENVKDEELIQYLALRLVAGQRADDGGWGYWCPPLQRDASPQLLSLLSEKTTALEGWREAAAAQGAPRDPGWRSDNSNTQFAALALWVAHRHGVAIGQTAELLGDRFRRSQQPEPEDGWPYCPADGTVNVSDWPTMTCSGLLGLAVANGTVPGGPTEDDRRRIARGLSRLGREIDRPAEGRGMDLYFLWSLERVAVLYGLDRIDNKDWYAWGVDALLPPAQAHNGSWPEQRLCGHSTAVTTSFALLFLVRANLAKDLTKLQLLAEQK
jgi:hypothetical protein